MELPSHLEHPLHRLHHDRHDGRVGPSDGHLPDARHVLGPSDKLWDGTVPFTRYADHIARVNGGSNPAPSLPTSPSAGAPTSSPPATPTPAPTITSIDNAVRGTGLHRFSFSDGWSSCTSCGNGRLFRGTTSWSSTAGRTVTIRFTGTQIRLYGERDPRHGIGEVFLDGTRKARLDYYAASRAENRLMWRSAILPAGTHTLTLRVTGQKNRSSAGHIVPLDRVAVSTG